MWGDNACALLKELDRCKDSLPPYNDDAIRVILEEMHTLNRFIEEIMNTTYDPDSNNYLAAIKARNAALERNKRCLLAYQWNRLERLRDMRWEFGSVLPPEIKSYMSDHEITWFNVYSKALASYMKKIGGRNGLNLMMDMQPPKHVYIQVLCLKDYGKIELESGEVVVLSKNSLHMMPRAQCEPLIRQGILQHLD